MLSKSGISLSWISAIKNILCITLTDIMLNILKCYNVSYILNVWQNSHKTFFIYIYFLRRMYISSYEPCDYDIEMLFMYTTLHSSCFEAPVVQFC